MKVKERWKVKERKDRDGEKVGKENRGRKDKGEGSL